MILVLPVFGRTFIPGGRFIFRKLISFIVIIRCRRNSLFKGVTVFRFSIVLLSIVSQMVIFSVMKFRRGPRNVVQVLVTVLLKNRWSRWWW